jgi:DNA polymerase-1
MPLVSTLIEVEKNGVHLDLHFLEEMSKNLESEIQKTEKNIFDICEEEFNLNSPKQLGPILFEKLEIHKDLGKKSPKKTKTGQYSTAESELEKYKNHKVIKEILDYRELAKLKSTYVDALPKLINKKSGAIHTSFNQTIAATGRLSSTDPNLQNIPIRTELGREIRKAFIPPKGKKILAADYSQIELRIAAHMSKDQQMIEAFKYGEDIHRSTASLIFNVELEKVTKDMRRKAKEINFGIIYGISQWGLASRLNISANEAALFINDYFKQFPGIKTLMMQTIAEARETNVVRTMLGRKRDIPEITSDNRMIREAAERVAINTPIQGSAADLIKIAMIEIQKELEKRNFSSKMILQVHDELVFEAVPEEIEELKKILNDKMSQAIPLSVPLKIDIGIGENWLEAH